MVAIPDWVVFPEEKWPEITPAQSGLVVGCRESGRANVSSMRNGCTATAVAMAVVSSAIRRPSCPWGW